MANEMIGWAVPGARNVFLPGYSKQRQAELILAYNINQDQWKLNNYVTLTNVDTLEGVYPRVYTPDRIRVEDPTGRDVVWPDGRPVNLYRNDANITKSRRTNVRWYMQRYLRKDTLGYLLIQQSPFDEIKLRQDELAMKSQLFRALKTISVITTTGNWPNRALTATALDLLAIAAGAPGSALTKWTAGTSTNQIMARSIGYMLANLLLGTIGAVKIDDVVLVMNPNTAWMLSMSQEIRAFILGFPGALDVIKGVSPTGQQWFLPQPLFGVKVLIEDAVKVTGNPNNNSDTPTFAWPDGTVAMLARPGSITSGMGGSPFSAVHIFQLRDHAFRPQTEDMGNIHQSVYVGLEDAFQPIVVAPEAGWVISGVI